MRKIFFSYVLYYFFLIVGNLLMSILINEEILYLFQVVLSILFFILLKNLFKIKLKLNSDYHIINISLLATIIFLYINQVTSKNVGLATGLWSIIYNFLFIALFEEYLFRNVYFQIISNLKGHFKGVLYSSFLFSIAHAPSFLCNKGTSIIFTLIILFIIGCLQCILMIISKDLLLVSIMHFINNVFNTNCYLLIILFFFLAYGYRWFKREF